MTSTVMLERRSGTEAVRAAAERTDRGRLARVARWVLTAVALALMVRFALVGWPEIRAALGALSVEHVPLIALAVAAEVLWVLAMSQVYRSSLMAFGGAVRRPAAVRVSMAAFTLSRVLPGGGAAGSAFAARELVALGNRPLVTVASMLTSWWLTMSALSLLVLAGVAWSVAGGALAAGYLAAPGALLALFAAGGGAVAIALRRPSWRARISQAFGRVSARLAPSSSGADESVDDALGALHRRRLIVVFGWGVAVWVLDATALWLSLAALGWQTEIGVLLAGYGVANLISALPELTPGWLGVIETSVAATLAALGVPMGLAVLGVLIYRLVSYWLPTAAGIPAALSVLGHRTPTSATS